MEVFGWDVPVWWVLGLGALYAAYKYSTATFNKFEYTHGAKGPRPYPLLGNMVAMLGKGIVEFDKETIGKYGKLIPLWFGRHPSLLVADVDLVKQITVKEFPSFNDRMSDFEIGPPGDKMLSMLQGDDWKRVRALVSPTFSSGKLRLMTEPIKKCCDALVETLSRQEKAVDVRLYAGAFTMDVIASTAFGLEIDSQSDPQNRFVKMASAIMDASFWQLRTLILIFCPALSNYLSRRGYGTMNSTAVTFFTSLVERAIKERKNQGGQMKDFLQLMMNANEMEETEDGASKSKKCLTNEEVLSQCMLFFLAGYDTIKSALTFLMFALACHPEIQEKVRQEIADNVNDDSLSYENLAKLNYLEMVISESLRLYTPTARIDRNCLEDITINGVFFPKGVAVSIPVNYLHNDPSVWPDPESFKPERFTEEAKAERNPYNYLPFGIGPRNCVAMRLAIMEIKMAIASILPKLKVVTTPETKIPIERHKLNRKPEECILGFEKIGDADEN